MQDRVVEEKKVAEEEKKSEFTYFYMLGNEIPISKKPSAFSFSLFSKKKPKSLVRSDITQEEINASFPVDNPIINLFRDYDSAYKHALNNRIGDVSKGFCMQQAVFKVCFRREAAIETLKFGEYPLQKRGNFAPDLSLQSAYVGAHALLPVQAYLIVKQDSLDKKPEKECDQRLTQ
jgi:hypothetical protein